MSNRTPMLLLLLPALGCQPLDPVEQGARAYTADIEPLLAENGLLSDRILETAAGVYNASAVTKETRLAWDQDIVPIAEHLRDQALVVLPPPEWSTDHKALLEVWTIRADAYRQIGEAMKVGDPELWKKGREAADGAKLSEEAWFRGTNERLHPYGIVLDQFP